MNAQITFAQLWGRVLASAWERDYLCGNHLWRAIMAPERPLGADAMQKAVEAQGAFRETDPSAPPGLWSKGFMLPWIWAQMRAAC